jgi:MFS family permease
VFTSFMLTSTSVIPIVGKLSDLYGRKPFFMGGIALFMIGSGLGGAGPRLFEATIGSMRSVLADGLGLVFLAGLAITVGALAACGLKPAA